MPKARKHSKSFKPRKSPKRPGYSIRQFAKAVDVSEHVIRGAVAAGKIDTLELNGIALIPPREKDRWVETWGESNQTSAA